MSGVNYFVTGARRAAARDVGQHAQMKQLIQLVEAATDDDLGTLVVAHAVLTHAADQRAAAMAVAKAAVEEREMAEVRRAQEASRARRRRQAERRRDELTVSLILSVLYAAFVGYFTSLISTGSFLERAGALLAVGMVVVAGIVIFDSTASSAGRETPDHRPAGTLRRLCVAAGLMVGTAPWLRFFSDWARTEQPQLGPSFRAGPFVTDWTSVTLPISFACGWVAGGMLNLAVGSFEHPSYDYRIGGTERLLRPLAWLGLISAVSYFTLYSWPPLASWLVANIGQPQVIPQWNPFGLWSHGELLIILGTSAMVLHHAARPVSGRALWLGYLAAYLGALLGLLSLVTNPGHIVTWLLDWAVRSFA